MVAKAASIEDLSCLVRFHRRAAELSRERLAEIAGVGKTVIYDIEHDKKTIQLQTLTKVLDALNIHTLFVSPIMDEYLSNQ